MTTVLGISLILLGLILWVTAGLLPVLRLQSRDRGTTDAALELTWMGTVRLHRRSIPGVTGARVTPGTAQIELSTREDWVPLPVPRAKPQLPPAQFASLITRYAKEGAPPKVLTLPLKDRMSTLITFGVLFPLGTMSIFSGVLLAIRGLG